MTGDDPDARPDAPPAGMPAASWGLPPAPPTRGLSPAAALAAAAAAAVVGACAWAALLTYTGYQVSVTAVVLGSVLGSLLCNVLGPKPGTGIVAGALTALACLVGEVVGTWGRAVHLGGTFALARHYLPVSDILRHAGGFTYLFVIFGVGTAYLTGVGQRNSFSSLGRRR